MGTLKKGDLRIKNRNRRLTRINLKGIINLRWSYYILRKPKSPLTERKRLSHSVNNLRRSTLSLKFTKVETLTWFLINNPPSREDPNSFCCLLWFLVKVHRSKSTTTLEDPLLPHETTRKSRTHLAITFVSQGRLQGNPKSSTRFEEYMEPLPVV